MKRDSVIKYQISIPPQLECGLESKDSLGEMLSQGYSCSKTVVLIHKAEEQSYQRTAISDTHIACENTGDSHHFVGAGSARLNKHNPPGVPPRGIWEGTEELL